MDKNELKKKVAELLKEEAGNDLERFRQAVGKLRELAEAVEASFTANTVRVHVEAGHRVNYGQQYNFVVYVDKAKLRDVLFRAYVPPDGFPVTLDLFDIERPECNDVGELENKVLDFLAHKDVKTRILEIRELAA